MTTWMVVEDEPDLYELVVSIYQAMNINDLSFTTGEEAMEWIEAVDHGFEEEEYPELALLDIRLPGDFDGVAVGSRMKSSPVLKNTIVVLMTAFKLSRKEKRQMMENAGAALLISKPFTMQSLLKKIRPLLEN